MKQNEPRRTISKRATLGRPELVEVIAALRRGDDVETVVEPWAGEFSAEDWNKVVAQTGDSDWKLSLSLFNVLKAKNALAVPQDRLADEADE